ncbi:MAG: hypothetical protein BMS9Abin30_0359 [Gammaproteobacteria bacterium]|nr:MAG: hypothetical protein BMS9Abin30_0359 [Gammaproteobacteria bacterium]
MSIISELKRRNVFRVGIAYAISAWVLMQIVDLVLENVNSPDWVMQVFMLALAIGFPLAVFFAWAFEMTPEGIKKEKDIDRSQSITTQTGRKLDRSIIVVLLFAVVYFAWDNFNPAPSASNTATETTSLASRVEFAAKSIAVLPFADLSQAQDQEWFADGLAEEILNVLAKTPDLLVSSRTSSFRYKGSKLDLPDIAQDLGVAHILEGSVRSSGKRIRVTAQLIRASDGFHVWSENYDRDFADMIEIQEDLARNIAKALKTTMDPEALAAMTTAGTRSVEAYEAYLRGQALELESFSISINEGSYRNAYQQFEKARLIDPNFASAHLRAADFWKVQLTPSRTASGLTDLEPRQMLTEFNARIDRAIATAPTVLDKKGYQAYKALFELRLQEAIRLNREYLQERPNDIQARFALFSTAALASDFDLQKEILAYWQERGLTDQAAAVSYINHAYRMLNPSVAADYSLQAIQRWPNSNGLMYQTHRTLMWAGRILEGKELADRYSRLNPGDDTLVRARQACAEGRRADAQAIYDAIDPNDADARSSGWHILKLLGDEQQAIEILRPYAESGVPYQMASWLIYDQFDPSPFPAVMAVLDREGIKRPAAVEIPFKCPPAGQTSIAVLPFVNMSNDADNEFFSDGIAEEILNVLASIPDLKVAARTSAFAYKGSNTNISKIAKELGVNHILEGSVRKAGNQVRVTAQLIKADDGFHLWSENYDRELTNIFAIQDEIASSIADALRVSLKLESSTAGNLTGTNSIEAYEYYLKGMSLWHERTAISLRSAIKEFEAAVKLDPQFAKAWAGQAITWGVISGYTGLSFEEVSPRAAAAANKALSLDPENVEALATLGLVARYEVRFQDSANYFKQAMAINPSYASAFQWYASTLGAMGDPEGELAMYRKAWVLDPRSRIIGQNLAWQLENEGYRDEALTVARELLSFAPDFPDGLSLILSLSIMNGDCIVAGQYASRLVTRLNKPINSTQVYLDLCQAENPALRASAIQAMLTWSNKEFANPEFPTLSYDYDLIMILSELNEVDNAWKVLEKSTDDAYLLPWIRSIRKPGAKRFRCDSRVQQMIQEAGLPPAVHPLKCN